MSNDINQRVREYRRRAKITRREMAQFLGMSYSEYSYMEREGDIKIQMLMDIAHHLGVEPSVLVISGMMVEYENITLQKNIDK